MHSISRREFFGTMAVLGARARNLLSATSLDETGLLRDYERALYSRV